MCCILLVIISMLYIFYVDKKVFKNKFIKIKRNKIFAR